MAPCFASQGRSGRPHDPVWGQVIAWAITGTLAAIGGVLYTHPHMWAQLLIHLGEALGWLAVTMEIPRGFVILLFLLLLVMLFGFSWLWSRMTDRAEARNLELLDLRHRLLAALQPRDVPAPTPPPAAELPPAPAAPPVIGDLDDRQRRALFILYDHYPGSMELRQLVQMLGLSYGRGEQFCEELERLAVTAANPWHGKQVRLTLLAGICASSGASFSGSSAVLINLTPEPDPQRSFELFGR